MIDQNDRKIMEDILNEMRAEYDTLAEVRDNVDSQMAILHKEIDLIERVLGQ